MNIRMRKALACLLVFALCLACTACSSSDKKNGNQKKSQSSVGQHKKKDKKSKDTKEQTDEEGKVGTDLSKEDARELAVEMMSAMSLREKVSQMFVVNLELLDDSMGGYYEHRVLTEKMQETMETYPVGGVVLFSRNIESREQTKELISGLQKSSHIPLFVTVDEEGGDVARIASNANMGTTSFPPMEEVAKNETKEYAYKMGETIGSEIKELGFNVNFAPVADVRTSESNTEIGNRSFGEDPDKVADYVVEVVKGLQDQGVSATLKHFPGHGDASEDSHEGSVNVDNSIMRMRKIDFVPFKAGIEAGADFIMISHISVSRVTESTTPASLSSLIMSTILREELGFEGIIITDAMDMSAITDEYSVEKASTMAVRGGADIILMPAELETAIKSIEQAVTDGKIDEMAIDDSVLRILTNKFRRSLRAE